jgi:hypothetical protein
VTAPTIVMLSSWPRPKSWLVFFLFCKHEMMSHRCVLFSYFAVVRKLRKSSSMGAAGIAADVKYIVDAVHNVG